MNLRQTQTKQRGDRAMAVKRGCASPSSVRRVRPSVHPPVRPLSLEEGLDAGVLGAL